MESSMDYAEANDRHRQRCIPSEILDTIVAMLLHESHTFASIATFTLVSWQCRAIAQRQYYRTLRVRSARHWVRMCQMRDIYTWVWVLDSPTTYFQYKINGLAHFKALRSLILDFSSDGLATQRSRSLLLFNNMTADLTELKLKSLPRLDTALLSLLAVRFPSLTTLELSCTERLDTQCCWLCFEESSSCTIHSPIPDVYPSYQALVNAFGSALTSLRHLKHLFLGVFLSDADMLSCHLDRCAAVDISSPRTGSYSPPPFGPDHCVICLAEHSVTVRERERLASVLFGRVLPSLRTIGWSTYFAKDRTGDDVAHKKTVFSIRATEEKTELVR